MNDEQKLESLINAIKAECYRLTVSTEPGVEDMRYRLENSLLAIGVEPYQPYPEGAMELVVIQRTIEDGEGRVAADDEQFYSRYGM